MSLNDCLTWKSFWRRGVWLLSALVVVGLAGCGERNPLSGLKIYPVKGKVTLPDGKALASGKVVFVATKSSITSSANLESDGSFTFKGGANGDGLPEGEYKVRLETDGATRTNACLPDQVSRRGRVGPDGHGQARRDQQQLRSQTDPEQFELDFIAW
jgi:hypothetical protein